MRSDVAILIVTYNSADHIVACLRSVYEQRKRVAQQVIVVDNGSTDDTVALVRAAFPDVILICPGRNLGFAAGVNLAARHAHAEFLLLLNPDTELLDSAVDTIVEFARCRPEFAFYGGRAHKPDGSLEPSSCWGLPTLWSLAMFASGVSTVAKRNAWLDPESLGSWQRDSVREVDMISGCFLLARQSVWNEMGGFDERYFMYGEDADLAMRARVAGHRSVVCPDARFIHAIGQSSATPLSKALLLYRGKASYVRMRWTGLNRAVGLWFLLGGVAFRGVATAALAPFRESSSNIWGALWKLRRDWLGGHPALDETSSRMLPEPSVVSVHPADSSLGSLFRRL